ncbi:MAG: response regulator [Pseudobacteriovorax sp.]|nr:response regulator [Pseudobacteriovorax sp.]
MNQTFKILVVDDNEQIVELITYELVEYLDDVHVSKAKDGLKALNLTNTCKFDLIVSDNVMPGIEGLDFIRSIRQVEGLNHQTPFILCSGNFKAQEFKGIPDCYILPKPYDPQRLQGFLKLTLNIDREKSVG